MKILTDTARLSFAGPLGRAAAGAALAVTIALAASPGAALAKHHRAANYGAGTGSANGLAAPVPASVGGTAITACGASISSNNYYYLTADLTYTGSGSCLSISKRTNVVLNLAGHTITKTGPAGTTVGISITNTGGGSGSITAYVEGLNGNVTGFATGVSVNDSNNGGFGNTVSVVIEGLNAGGNGTGFLAQGSNITLSNVAASSNTSYGVEFDACANCSLNFGDFESNTTYGVWVNHSTYTSVNSVFVQTNGVAGVYLGCNATSPGGTCGGGTQGNNDSVFNNVSGLNPGGGVGYGFYVRTGETNDSISNNTSNTTPSGNLDDGFDGNTNCGTNQWFGDLFANVNNACVQ